MLRFFRTTFGLVFSLVVLVSSFLFFVVFIATKSHPEVSGELDTKGIRDSVAIYRNAYGIPHIVGQSDADAFFGMGYAHAQDRLWQMDIARRAGSGRLSEIFGRRTLDLDMFLRSFGIHRTASRLYKHISSDSRMALEAYARGVNAYMEHNASALPFEFDALDYRPAPWRPEDCLIVGRMMAWEMNMSFWSDAAFGELAASIGRERAEDLVPSWPSTAPTVMNDQKKAAPRDTVRAVPDSAAPQTAPPALGARTAGAMHVRTAARLDAVEGTDAMFAQVLVLQERVREFLKSEGSSRGSNCLVMRKSRSEKSGVVLANDPHLMLMAPARWYEAHLTSPTMNVVGMTIPGIPFVVVGRNDRIAWGITNMMLDDCDYFIEKVDSSNKRRYVLPNGSSRAFTVVRDTIVVKDSSDAIIDFRYTQRSAVISDVHPLLHPDKLLKINGMKPGNFFQKYVLTYSWTGHAMSDDILAMYRLQKAQSWEQFLRAVNIFSVPGLNFCYADTRGNYGIAPAGMVPKRGSQCNPNFPNPGWNPDAQWTGFHQPSALPRLYNPASGFVFSANNKTMSSPPFHISSLWEPPSRAVRMHELLSSYQDFSAQEAAIMQSDVVSPHAQELLAIALPSLQARRSWMDTVERRSFDTLARWNYLIEANEVNSAIYAVFVERLTRNIFEDDLGRRLFLQYAYITNIPTRRTLELLQDSSEVWFDDRRTPKRETRHDIIFRSFREAVVYLRSTFRSADFKAWNYGSLHTLTIAHLLSEAKPLDKVVNIGPFPIGGDGTTINNAEWKFHKPFVPVIGASMRFVCDMQDTVVQVILPGGNSGQPLSAHYANQVQLWLNGGFISIPVSREPHPSFVDHLVLVPVTDDE